MATYSILPVRDINIRKRSFYVCGSLILLNTLIWLLALSTFHHTLQLGAAILAYSFGLRHGVDADHIAAIDNVTRRFMQQGQRSVSIGLYFSLGHSTVVILVTLGILIITTQLQGYFVQFREISAIIGTSFSVLFLLLLASLNISILFSTSQRLRKTVFNNHQSVEKTTLNANMSIFSSKWLSKLFNISHSWQMYLVGFIFALSFDTASEIGLLSLTTAQATHASSLWPIFIYPALFTVAMMLVDTFDNVLMLEIYGCDFIKPMQRVYYNLFVTFISVLLAVLVSSMQGLGLLVNLFNLSGGGWSVIRQINDNSSIIGFCIIGFFILSWFVSILILRSKQVDVE